MILNTNINAIKTEGDLKKVTDKNTKLLERLSSGRRINRAADDSAGFAITETMKAQLRCLTQASRNIQDGNSFVQVADGALSKVHEILGRGKELCVQAATDSLTPEDRQKINEELEQLNRQIDRIGIDTEFNTLKVFLGGVNPADVDMFNMIAEVWVASALDAIHNIFPSLNTAGLNHTMELVFANISGGTMASMSASGPVTGPNAGADNFILTINTNYFNPDLITEENDSGGGTATTGYELYDKIIAHEMTHAVMYDTMWSKIVGPGATIPDWFMEGVAEAIGGGFYRIDNMLTSDIQNDLGNGGLSDYSSGYAASLYLGYLAGGGNMNNIAAGLDEIFTELMTPGTTFDQALQATIGMDSTQFRAAFQSVAGANFIDDLRFAVTGGSGSVLVPFTTTPADTIIDSANQTTSDNYFTITNALESIDSALIIHIGANANQNIKVSRFGLSSTLLGLPSISMLGTRSSYDNAIQAYDDAVNTVSTMRTYYGAIQNRMEYSMSNVNFYAENIQSAESRIRDADMSLTIMEFTKTNVLSQAATAMLAQANQFPQNILTLLR